MSEKSDTLSGSPSEIEPLVVSSEEAGERIDVLICRYYPDLSRSRVQKLIDEGAVTVNGRPVKKNHRTEAGEKIELTLPEVRPSGVLAEDIPLKILFEDKDLLVVAKPAGISVHPSPAESSGTLVNALLFHVKDLSGIGGVERPGIVHRLDKDTSGVMLVAKSDEAHEKLAKQLAEREIKRSYYALVFGSPEENEATIDIPIARSRTDRKRMTTDKEGRVSVTHFRVKERVGVFTLLDIDLSTGRTHQIRVHLSHIGLPIVGDAVYFDRGKREKMASEVRDDLGSQQAAVVLGLKRQFLHAYKICFSHPRTGAQMEFSEELPKDLMRVLEAARSGI